MKTSEGEIRQALRQRAEGFDMPVDPPRHVVDAIRRRRSRNGMLVGLGSSALVAVVAASIFAARLPGSGTPGSSVPPRMTEAQR
jgi:hypothetical protein